MKTDNQNTGADTGLRPNQDGGAVTGDLYDPHQQTFDQPGNAIAPRRMLWEVCC